MGKYHYLGRSGFLVYLYSGMSDSRICVCYVGECLMWDCKTYKLLTKRTRRILLSCLLVLLGVVYYVYDPSQYVLFPKCPVMAMTGYPCAGCGSQRAIHALLHLDMVEAARYNFAVIVFLPIIAVLEFASFMRSRMPKLYLMTHGTYVCYVLLGIILLWWVLRIVFGWYVWETYERSIIRLWHISLLDTW